MEKLFNAMFYALILCTVPLLNDAKGLNKRQEHHTPAPTTQTNTQTDPLAAWMSKTSRSKPNVLFLVTDDLRPKLGSWGEMNMMTPNLDNLASKSVMFRQAFAQVALCAPSRTSFLTGRRPDTTHVYDLNTYFRTAAGNFTTLPQYFKEHGYLTQGCGKIFHPGKVSSGNDDRAYSWNTNYFLGADPFGWDNAQSNAERVKAAFRPVDTSKYPKLRDVSIADFAVNFLRDHVNNRDRPFFLAVGFIKPHLPWAFPKEYLDLYPLSSIHLAQHRSLPAEMPRIAWSNAGEIREYHDVRAVNTSDPGQVFPDDFQKTLRRGYSAATSHMDAQLGRVLKALSQYGFADNTIISFLGDHGWHLGDNAEWCKHTNFEMALRIPMMLYVPGVTSNGHHFDFIDALAPDFNRNYSQVPGGKHVTDELVEAIDLYPTLTELSGLPVPHTCPEDSAAIPTCLEGTSLVPLVKQVRGLSNATGMQWKQAAFSQYERNSGSAHPVMGYTVRTKTHRYTEWVHFDKTAYKPNFSSLVARELYQHSSDPYEFHNLAEVTSYSGKVQEMSQILRNGWRKTQQDYLATLPH